MNLPTIGLLSMSAFSLVYSSEAKAEENIGNGATKFSPSIGLATQYRTNVYLEEGEVGGGEATIPGMALLINPVLKFAIDGDNVRSVVGASYFARKYLAEELTNLDRFNDGQVSAGLELLPNSVVGFTIDEMFSSSGRETAADDDANSSYTQRIFNEVRSGISIAPGSALKLKLGGSFLIEDITGADDGSGVADRSHNNKQSYGAYADLLWKFLPKTSFYIQTRYDRFDWWKNVINTTPEGDGCANPSNLSSCYLVIPNGTNLQVTSGFTGQLTDKLLLKFGLGWGNAVYDQDSLSDDVSPELLSLLVPDQEEPVGTSGLDGLMLEASIGFMLTQNQQFVLGFERAFEDVYFTNYSVYNQVLFTHSWMILNRASWSNSVRYRLDNYSGLITRTDNRIAVQSELSVSLQRLVSINLGTSWRRLTSANNPGLEYDDVNIYGGLVFGY